MGGATCQKTLISWSALDKNLKAGYLFEGNPVYEGKKHLNDPDNHNGVITDLEPDVLEYEVKWALESITTNIQPVPSKGDHPWDSSGKNTGVGCHFLLQCMKVKSESEIAQSCPTLSDPMDCSLPGSSVHGIFQARVPDS